MNAVDTEMLYLTRRLTATRAMADAAAGPCARVAHERLAHLYGEALAALSVQAAGLVCVPVPPLAVRARPATRARLVPLRPRLTLKLAS